MSRWVALFFVSTLVVSSISAQPQRTFVSSTGLDTNSCLRLDPCRNFAAALAVVADGGEVVALDSAGFGPFTVSKPVAVVSPLGVHAAIATTSGNAITINVPDGTVALRGLYINSPNGASAGIQVLSPTPVILEGLVINGFFNGISDQVGGVLVVTDSTVRQIGANCLFAGAPGGLMKVVVEHSRFENCAFSGINIFQGGEAVVHDSIVTNSLYGFVAQSFNGFGVPGTGSLTVDHCAATHNTNGLITSGNSGTTFLEVSDSFVANNGLGIQQGTGGTVRVSRSTIVRNTTGVSGTILSRSNNTLEDNDTNGTLTTGTFTAK
jgi:hypothetical protein